MLLAAVDFWEGNFLLNHMVELPKHCYPPPPPSFFLEVGHKRGGVGIITMHASGVWLLSSSFCTESGYGAWLPVKLIIAIMSVVY